MSSSRGEEFHNAKGAVKFIALYWFALVWLGFFLLLSSCLFLYYTKKCSVCFPLVVCCFGFRDIIGHVKSEDVSGRHLLEGRRRSRMKIQTATEAVKHEMDESFVQDGVWCF